MVLWGENPTGLNRCPPTRSGSCLISRDQEVFLFQCLCFGLAAQPAGLVCACLPQRGQFHSSPQPRPHQSTELPPPPPAGSGQPRHQRDNPASMALLLLLKFLSPSRRMLHYSITAAVAPFQQFPTQHLRQGFMSGFERHFGVRRSYGKGSRIPTIPHKILPASFTRRIICWSFPQDRDQLSAVALCLAQSISQQQDAAGVILLLLAKAQEAEAPGCRAPPDPVWPLIFL